MPTTILAYVVSDGQREGRRQIVVPAEAGLTFDRSSALAAIFRDGDGNETHVSFFGDKRFPEIRESESDFVDAFPPSEGFTWRRGFSLSDEAFDALNAAVPSGAIVVVIDGAQGQNATVFHGAGRPISAVRSGGRKRLADLSDQ